MRSGILVSDDALALDNVRGAPLFSLFALISLASLALYGWRARDGGPAVRFSGLSREMLILATLLLFCAVLLIVLVGTLYPMILACWAGDASPLAHRFLTAQRWPVALDVGGDVLATFVSGKRVQLAGAGGSCRACCLLPCGGGDGVSRQEISLNLSRVSR
ncbi:cytochrome c-type biogenesis CcmF C-terminal domain-containing protein [Shigella flexneri]